MSALAEAKGWRRKAARFHRQAAGMIQGSERDAILAKAREADNEARWAWDAAIREAGVP